MTFREKVRKAYHVFYPRPEGNLLKFARRELISQGFNLDERAPKDWNRLMATCVLELIRTFSDQGHSGMSARDCISIFKSLASFEPLGPLTGVDEEWMDIDDRTCQNIRCSHVFKDKLTGIAYDSEGIIFTDPDGSSWINRDSRVNITFPYKPIRRYVDRKTQMSVTR